MNTDDQTNAPSNLEIPKSLILGTVTYNVSENPDLEAFVSAVRTAVASQEKKKVYSQMEAIKKQVQELKSANVTSESPIDVEALVSRITEAVTTQVSEKFNASLATAFEPFNKKNKMIEEASLNDYRLKLISDNQMTCIPELVVGKTKEELDAALTKSIEIRKTYGTNAVANTTAASAEPVSAANGTGTSNAQTQNTQGTQNANNTTEALPVIQAPAALNADATNTLPDIKNMSEKDFAKNREALLEQLKASS